MQISQIFGIQRSEFTNQTLDIWFMPPLSALSYLVSQDQGHLWAHPRRGRRSDTATRRAEVRYQRSDGRLLTPDSRFGVLCFLPFALDEQPEVAIIGEEYQISKCNACPVRQAQGRL